MLNAFGIVIVLLALIGLGFVILNNKSRHINKTNTTIKNDNYYEDLSHVSQNEYDESSDWEKYYNNRDSGIKIKAQYVESTSIADSYYRDVFLTSITDKTLILDTETTGLDDKAEIIEISIIDMKGNVLLDTFIKPKKQIPLDAIQVHGITNEMVQNAPKWEDIYKDFRAIVKAADLVLIYNEKYDKRLIMQTCRLAKVATPTFTSDCIMNLMARWNGERKRNGDYMPKKLAFIAKARKIEVTGDPHRSLTDCNTVRKIINSFLNN